jgi:hypothetical protein
MYSMSINVELGKGDTFLKQGTPKQGMEMYSIAVVSDKTNIQQQQAPMLKEKEPQSKNPFGMEMYSTPVV